MITSQKKARLEWQCRRGMLELDLILIRFVKNKIDSLNEKQVAALENLLNHSDPELLSWLMGHGSPIDMELKEIVELIKLQDSPH